MENGSSSPKRQSQEQDLPSVSANSPGDISDIRIVRHAPRAPKVRAKAKRILILVMLLVCFCVCIGIIALSLHFSTRANAPRNIIFMVSDGFGEAGLTLARVYKNRIVLNRTDVSSTGQPQRLVPLALDSFVVGNAHTYSASQLVTDSAAGATAWACAQKTTNLYVGTSVNDEPCGTLMEAAKAAGFGTGVAVTSSVTDATPASFTAHVRRRALAYSIALQIATNRTADVVMGGGRLYFDAQNLAEEMQQQQQNGKKYTYVKDAAGLRAAAAAPLLGLFAEDNLPYDIDRPPSVPSLAEMAMKAVALLADQQAGEASGFFLLVEGSKIDKAAHPNDAGSHVREILAYDAAVEAVLRWARQDGSTLVISTSDHETGGLSLGRESTIRTLGAATIPEAPLRTRTFAGEALDAVDDDYNYYLSPLLAQTASTEQMARDAMVASGDPSAEELAASPELRDKLLASLVSQMEVGGGLGRGGLAISEIDLLSVCVSLFYNSTLFLPNNLSLPRIGLGEYGCQCALGSIIASRSKIGFSSWGHSGEDVKVHAYGPGSARFAGSIENTDIGRRLEQLMGWDLQAVTANLGEPIISQLDKESENPDIAPFAVWQHP